MKAALFKRSLRGALLHGALLLGALACQSPSPHRMLALAPYSEATLADLQASWGVPLVIVRDIVYAPPAACLPLADESTRARVDALTQETEPLQGPLVLILPCHPVPGFHEYVVRGAGYRRVRSFNGERMRVERDAKVLYSPAAH